MGRLSASLKPQGDRRLGESTLAKTKRNAKLANLSSSMSVYRVQVHVHRGRAQEARWGRRMRRRGRPFSRVPRRPSLHHDRRRRGRRLGCPLDGHPYDFNHQSMTIGCCEGMVIGCCVCRHGVARAVVKPSEGAGSDRNVASAWRTQSIPCRRVQPRGDIVLEDIIQEPSVAQQA